MVLRAKRTSPGKITKKQVLYVKGVIQGKTKRQAALDAYDTTNPSSASRLALIAEKNPVVLDYLRKHQEEMEQTVLDVVRDAKDKAIEGTTSAGAMYARVAIDGSNSILDRVHGKATQNVNMNVQAVNLNVDLSQ